MNGEPLEPEPLQDIGKENVDKKETLKEKGVVYFDVGLTQEERYAMERVQIEREPKEFDYYGPVNDELVKKLTDYFNRIGDNAEEIINNLSALVARMADGVQKDFNAEYCWVNVRTFLPTNEYDIPRWHKDGGYFKSNEEFYKLVFPIKGSPTRFAKVLDAKRYEKLEREDAINNSIRDENSEEFKKENIRIRKELMEVVEEIEPPSNEQGALYTVNNRQTSTIHSEPKMHGGSRIFMQVLPGPKEKIEEWENRSKK